MKSLLLSIMILFAGCTIVTPPISEYRIDIGESKAAFSQKMCSDKSLRVSQVFGSNSLMSQKMKYAHGKYKENYYTKSEWAESPSKAISSEILKSVHSSKLFFSVLGYKTRSQSDYILESRVEDFMQYFSKDEQSSYVNVAIVMSLLESKSGKVIASHNFEVKKVAQSADAQGGVEALNTALRELLGKSNQWLSKECQ